MSRPTREELLRSFECYAYERRAGSDLAAANALTVGGQLCDAIDAAERDLTETRRLLALAEAVIGAVKRWNPSTTTFDDNPRERTSCADCCAVYDYDAEPQIVHLESCAVVAYEKALAAWDRRNEEK